MKYSYTLIVFIILILYQVLLTFALDDYQQSNDQYDGFKSEHKSLSRNKRQIFRGLNSNKRNDYGYNENGDELDEQNLSANNGNNQKKSKFVAWGGKRSDSSANQKQQNGQHNNLNTYLPLATKRFRSWGGKRSEKPFRTWGGKRSNGLSDGDSLDLNIKLNDYLKRLELLGYLINEFDAQNYD